MKAGIVKSSTLSRHKRWCPHFFLWDQRHIDKSIQRAEKRIEDALGVKARAEREIERLKAEEDKGRKFLGKMIENGEVVPIE